MIKTEITGIGDPFILRCGKGYYLYATDAPDGFKCFYSENLVDWRCKGYCYRGTWGDGNFWAPEVYRRGDKYMLLFTARQKSTRSLRIGLAFSDSPEGPFTDSGEGPLFDFGYAAIDATAFFDDDGKAYMYYSRDCSENIVDGRHTSVIYGMEVDPGALTPLSEPIVVSAPDLQWEFKSGDWRWNEGPAVIKRGGIYYLNYSANCYSTRDYSVGCSQAESPLGPFVKYAEPILVYRENEFSGPGHNHFFTDPDGKLYTTFHIHTDYDRPSGNRRACIAPVVFGPDSKMIIDVDGE